MRAGLHRSITVTTAMRTPAAETTTKPMPRNPNRRKKTLKIRGISVPAATEKIIRILRMG